MPRPGIQACDMARGHLHLLASPSPVFMFQPLQLSWLSTHSTLFLTSLHLLTHPLCPHSSSARPSFFGYRSPYSFGLSLHTLGFHHLQPEKSFVLPSHLVHVPATALLHCFVLEFNSPSSPVSSLRARTLSYSRLHLCASHRIQQRVGAL